MSALDQFLWAANQNNGNMDVVNQLRSFIPEGWSASSCVVNGQIIQASLRMDQILHVPGGGVLEVDNVLQFARYALSNDQIVLMYGRTAGGVGDHLFTIASDIIDGVRHARVFHAFQNQHLMRGETRLPLDRFLSELRSSISGNVRSQQIIFGARQLALGRIGIRQIGSGVARIFISRPTSPVHLIEWIIRLAPRLIGASVRAVFGGTVVILSVLTRASSAVFGLVGLASLIADPFIHLGFEIANWVHINSKKSIKGREAFTTTLCDLLMKVFNRHGDHHIMIQVEANYSWDSSGARDYGRSVLVGAGIGGIVREKKTIEKMPNDCVMYFQTEFDRHKYNVWVFKGADVFTNRCERGKHNLMFNSSLPYHTKGNRVYFGEDPHKGRLYLKGVSLRNKKSGKYLTMGSTAIKGMDLFTVTQEVKLESRLDRYDLEELSNGAIQITVSHFVSPSEKKPLRFDLLNTKYAEGNRLACCQSNDAETQQFRLIPTDDTFFTICPVNHPELAIDIKDGSMADGADVILWNNHGGANQQFEVCCTCCYNLAEHIKKI